MKNLTPPSSGETDPCSLTMWAMYLSQLPSTAMVGAIDSSSQSTRGSSQSPAHRIRSTPSKT